MRVLIVRYDAIGDYILFRHVLAALSRAPGFARAQLTLLGNGAWRNLFETLDTDCVAEAVWCKPGLIARGAVDNLLPNILQQTPQRRQARAELSAKLGQTPWDVMLNLQWNRDPLFESLLATWPAQRRIGVRTGLPSDRNYGELLEDNTSSTFIFERNSGLAQQLLDGNGLATAPSVPVAALPASPLAANGVMPCSYAAFFTGASHWTKRWPLTRMWAVARDLALARGLRPVLLGGPGDRRYPRGEAVETQPKGMIDLRGELTLSQTWRAISEAALVVTNDTCAFHMAAAAAVPCVCPVNGLAGRNVFWPYPAHMGLPSRVLDPGPVPPWTAHSLVTRQLALAAALRRITVADVLREAQTLLNDVHYPKAGDSPATQHQLLNLR